MKYQFKNFQDKVKQYGIRNLYNTRDIIIFVWDLKDPYAHFGTENPTNLNK